MIYNGDASGQDIVTLSEDFSHTNSRSFPIRQKTRFANMGLKQVLMWIYEVFGYQYDDSNNTTLPEATRTLTANQTHYPLPDGSDHLFGVSFMDTSGFWQKLLPITLEEIQSQCAESEFQNVPGYPIYYRPVADGFKIYPAASFSQSASLKIQISRDEVDFTITSTDAVPGFDPLFHEAVPTFMALQKAEIDRLPNVKDLRKKWSNDTAKDPDYPEGFEQKIKKYYQVKFKQFFPPHFHTQDVVGDYM